MGGMYVVRQLPPELWAGIIDKLDYSDLRHLMQVSNYFHELISTKPDLTDCALRSLKENPLRCSEAMLRLFRVSVKTHVLEARNQGYLCAFLASRCPLHKLSPSGGFTLCSCFTITARVDDAYVKNYALGCFDYQEASGITLNMQTTFGIRSVLGLLKKHKQAIQTALFFDTLTVEKIGQLSSDGYDFNLRHKGTSLVERAIINGKCRSAVALVQSGFAFQPSAIIYEGFANQRIITSSKKAYVACCHAYRQRNIIG